MRTAFAILRKELATAVASPGSYGGLAALFALSSLFFTGLLDTFQEAQLAAQQVGWGGLPPDLQRYRNLTDGVLVQLWGVLAILVLFAAPLVGMRLFAEERRQRTLELLLVAPVTEAELVAGKFLAGLVQLAVPLVLCLAFPVLLELFGTGETGRALEWPTVWLGWSGLVLLAAATLALCVWVSAGVRSELAAALGGFAVLLPWMMLGELGRSAPEPMRTLASRAALDLQLRPLFSGLLAWRAPVFLLSVTAAFLLLARETLRRRRTL